MDIKNKYIFFIIFHFLFIGCSNAHVNSIKKDFPTKSFVKIFHTTVVQTCVDPKDKTCPVGSHVQIGSGMAIDLISNEMTVITAGHVCQVGLGPAIKESNQFIHVVDYLRNVHQAWPILITHNNQKGNADLCMLWVPTLQTKKVKYSMIEPRIGDKLNYIGAPKGIYHPPNVPIFEGIFSGNIDASSALFTAPAAGGASGSAILNEKREIVGILWGVNSQFNNVATMSNYKAFLLFLKSSKEQFKIKFQ